MDELRNEDVVMLAKESCLRSGEPFTQQAENEIWSRGPYRRMRIPGERIGMLKAQYDALEQRPISTVFHEFIRGTTDAADSAMHRYLVQELLTNGDFDFPPIYHRGGIVFDGMHRSMAAYDVYLHHDSNVAITVVGENLG